jgi:2'-5' RNA ligase
MTGSRRPRGQTIVLAKVPEADPVVGPHRLRHDAPAAAGLPAHITVLYPYLSASRLTPGTLSALRDLMAAHRPVDLTFTAFGRFPDALWLSPVPAAPLCALTAAIAARWPEAPPHEGRFPDVIPHLTVASGRPAHVYDAVEAALAPALPLTARIGSVHLMVSDGATWHDHTEFVLGSAAPRVSARRGTPT